MSWKDTSLSDLPRVSSTLSDISGDSSRQFATFPKSMSGKTSLKSLRRASSSVIEKHIIVNVDQDETDEIKQLMKDEGLSRDEAVKQFFDDHDDKLFNPKAVYLFPGEVYTPKKHDDDDDEDEDGMFGHVKYHHRASLMSPPAAPVTPPPAAEPEPEPEPEVTIFLITLLYGINSLFTKSSNTGVINSMMNVNHEHVVLFFLLSIM